MTLLGIFLVLLNVFALVGNFWVRRYHIQVRSWLTGHVRPQLHESHWATERDILDQTTLALLQRIHFTYANILPLVCTLALNCGFLAGTRSPIDQSWLYPALILGNAVLAYIAYIHWRVVIMTSAQIKANRAVLEAVRIYNETEEES